ncbi:hypothetical protein TCAL_09947 [Tigriopus californicus]|uniref:ABC transporter domain-containing protein n=1 Tax=Tigriopus californicus TaxID=6832 RepID=A0A553PDW8_TIGCA|nr:hypothetical protein TCAL_09947 [Tigriopus californicus]
MSSRKEQNRKMPRETSEGGGIKTSEDLHAWSIYRQNLNSDFTDSALGSCEKSPMPYGNFHLRETTMQSILSNPKYGPKSELGSNVYTYLKFGLPRVLPPHVYPGLDNSSGYDSTDEERGIRTGPHVRGSHSVDNLNSVARSKFDSFYPMTNELGEFQQSRLAKSELNLARDKSKYWIPDGNIRSQEIGSRASATTPLPKSRSEKKTSEMGMNSIPAASIEAELAQYPHIQLRDCSLVEKASKLRLLEGLTMEAQGGELVGVLATNAENGSLFCDLLSGTYPSKQYYSEGQILLNGHRITRSRLRSRVSYARSNHCFPENLSVRQVMLFRAYLQESEDNVRNKDVKGRHARVKNITASEKRRLNLAVHLLLDADVTVIDQPTNGMDIFDTFFLVEYLRQWASRGRLIVITIHPPTYEILTMISKVVLVSMGRIIYCGKRREMLPYFAFIDYPCPAYKNPSDYYLDLVTLDDLSQDAILESRQRIVHLATTFSLKAEPLSDPGPPGMLPPKFKAAQWIVQIMALMVRDVGYLYPYNIIFWAKTWLLAGIISLLFGLFFIGIRWKYWNSSWVEDPSFEQDNVVNRFGLIHVLLCFALWPVLCSMVQIKGNQRAVLQSELQERLYSNICFHLVKNILELIPVCLTYAAYIIPGLALVGVHQDIDYLVLAVLGFIANLTTTFSIHSKDTPYWARSLSLGFPNFWAFRSITRTEFESIEVLRCSTNPVITENSIIKQVPCGLPDGPGVIKYFELNEESTSGLPIPDSLLSLCVMYILLKMLNVLGSIFFQIHRK